MSMLAEAKRKHKFGPDPRNTFWCNDENKFGFRMLESMGWKKGKGLGAKESGMTEHLKAEHRKSVDVRGLGCSKKHADNWIAHQDDFNALLSSLNETPEKSDAASKPAEATVTSVSLEEKSKSSRSRMRYHKFARGKDLSSRSTQDLDCIFGRRKGQSSENSTPTAQSKANTDEDSSSGSQNNKTPSRDVHSHGVKTITSSSSVKEYFAKKMAELKLKKQAGAASISPDDSSRDSDHSTSSNNKEESANEAVVAMDCDSALELKPKKKKKRAKGKEQEDSAKCEEQLYDVSQEQNHNPDDHCQGTQSAFEEQQSLSTKRKGKKKSKARENDDNDNSINNEVEESHLESEESQEDRSPKKTKKRKPAELNHSDSGMQQTFEVTNEKCTNQDHCGELKKKKKKKKKRKSSEGETERSFMPSILRQENDGKTRRRKSVSFSLGEAEVFLIPSKEDEVGLQQKEVMPNAEDGTTLQEKGGTRKTPKKRKKQDIDKEDERAPLTEKTTEEETVAPLAEEEEEYVPKKKTRKSDYEENASLKKTCEVVKENQETKRDQSEQNDPPQINSSLDQSESCKKTAEAASQKAAENRVSSGLRDELESRRMKNLSQEEMNRVCKMFHGAMKCIKGYGKK